MTKSRFYCLFCKMFPNLKEKNRDGVTFFGKVVGLDYPNLLKRNPKMSVKSLRSWF